MPSTILHVKNMVCHRCVLAVESILTKAGIEFQTVTFGEIHLAGTLPAFELKNLRGELGKIGFELVDNHLTALIEKIKQLIIRKARNELDKKEGRLNLSVYLAQHLNYEYTYLSGLFSSVEGRTIENYFIDQRIEKAKEMLIYGDKTLSEIAHLLDYSSTAHLSGQFKKITGLTPSYFKEVGSQKRKALDKI